jgi:hypothetical protein
VAVLIVITVFAVFVIGSVGLFMTGIAALRQSRLSKRMFDLRFRTDAAENSNDSKSN